tara:strand:- start:52 stop:207 length:156 start_codon:yes stop_codon:yes gene_type:complete
MINSRKMDLTPTPQAMFEYLWLVATESTNLEDRKWARQYLKNAYILARGEQ